MLGTISRVFTDQRQLTMNIEVDPSLDLDRLSHLFIITGGVNPPLPELAPGRMPGDSLEEKPRRRIRPVPAPRMTIRMPEGPSPAPSLEEGATPPAEGQP
jgi:hypothetical protein